MQPPTLSILVFRHRPRSREEERRRADRDRALMEAVLEDGTTMLSTTELAHRTALRFVVQSHRTTEDEVRTSVRRVREIAAGLDERR